MFDISVVSEATSKNIGRDTSFNVNNLAKDLHKPSPQSIFSYNASSSGMAKAEQLLAGKSAENIFYNTVSKINFGGIKIHSMSNEMLNAVKSVKDNLNRKYAKLMEPIDAAVPAYEAMLQKQMDVSIASLEVEIVSKIAGKSIENLYMLLRQ